MNRDYVNYKRKRERHTKRNLLWLFLFFCALGAALVFYGHKQGTALSKLSGPVGQAFSTYISKIFQHPRKTQLASKKRAANAPKTIKPIHFDFYDELPKAQLDFPPEQESEKDSMVEMPKTTVAMTKKPRVVVAQKKKEDEIVRELATDLSAMKTAETSLPYILQLGEFRSLEAAKRYHLALTSAGLKADLVKSRMGKEIVYRLQQGPYHSLDQLRLAKKRLTERGIACDIRKLPPYVM